MANAERKVDTELDYVTNGDMNAYYIDIVDAVTGEKIDGVTEANAVDGWFYEERLDDKRQPITERFVDDRGHANVRIVRFRVEKPIAIVFNDRAPASLRSQEFRLKAQ